jgi:hypothetical protein
MKSIRRFASLSIALALGIPAAAQTVDSVSTPPTGNAGFTYPSVSNNGGTPKAVLFDNGSNIVTHPGAGAGGANASAIEPGLITFGYGHQFALGYRVADDFSVPASACWDLSQLKWLAYQTNAPTTGTITGIYTEYFSGGSPAGGGLPFAGDTTTNRFVSSVWSGVYRVTSTSLTNAARAVIQVTANASFVTGLGTGTYWVGVNCSGTLSSGPWAPPTVPWDGTDNGQQFTGAWAPLTGGFGGSPADFPFVLEGGPCGSGGVGTTFCTQTKATTVASCIASLSVSSTSLATGTWDMKNIPLGPASGGTTIGIFIYTQGVGIGQSAFSSSVPFGLLCLTPGSFLRTAPTCAPVSILTGVVNTCHPAFPPFMPSCNAPGLDLSAGEDVNVQGWYRDPGAVGNANFSNAVFYTLTL